VHVPVEHFPLLEPETDLALAIFGGVASVDHVTANLDSQVAADGPWLGLQGVGGPNQLPCALDDAIALENLLWRRNIEKQEINELVSLFQGPLTATEV